MFLLAAAAVAAMAAAPDPVPQETSHYAYPGLGEVHVFAPVGAPRGVAVVLSGDGGWKPAEASGHLVETLAQRGILALGLDVNPVMDQMAKGKAPYDLAATMTAVATDAQARYHASGPVYFGGYSAGATLAYAAIAQAQSGKVAGLVTAGFCPDQDTVNPVGSADGHTIGFRMPHVAGWVYRPVALGAPWALVEGGREHGCPGGAVDAFVSRTPGARLWTVANVRHSFAPFAAWRTQLDAALDLATGKPD